jgi:hypothetical protein
MEDHWEGRREWHCPHSKALEWEKLMVNVMEKKSVSRMELRIEPLSVVKMAV